MLDFTQFKRLESFNDLKSRQSAKFIILPETLDAEISFKTLMKELTWSEVGSKVDLAHFFQDQSYYSENVDEFSLIDLTGANVIMIDRDKSSYEEDIVTFENDRALERYVHLKSDSFSDAVYLELNEEMIKELAAKTVEDQLSYYDNEIGKTLHKIELESRHLKDLEAAKDKLMNSHS